MNDLSIEASKATPEINFSTNGHWSIEGKCCPENPIEFFDPIFEWIESYKLSDSSNIELSLKLSYFNTSSSKAFLDFFDLMFEVKEAGKEVKVLWFYEENDEDMLESGEEFSEDVDLDFEFIEYKES